MKTFLGFVQSFQLAMRDVQLYSLAHPRAAESTKKAFDSLLTLLGEAKRLQLACTNGRLLVNREPADRNNAQVGALLRQMEERKLYGLVVSPGLALEELQALLGILATKPQRVDELGGVAKLLEAKKVEHIRVLKARFEEVGEDEDLISVKGAASLIGQAAAAGGILGAAIGAAGEAGAGAGAPAAFATGPGPAAALRGLLGSLAAGGFAPADLSGLAGFFADQGLEGEGAQPRIQALFQEGFQDLPPTARLGVLRGIPGLTTDPLRQALGALVPGLMGPTLAAAYAQGAAPKTAFLEAADELLPFAPNRAEALQAMQQSLRQENLKPEELDELFEVLTWADRPIEDKVAKLLEGSRIFEMPRDWVLAFLRELLESGRFEEFCKVMEHYATGLQGPVVARRLSVAEAFDRIASWVPILGMPPDLLAALFLRLRGHYGAEKDPEVHQWTSRAVERILGHWIDAGDLSMARSEFMALTLAMKASGEVAPWKEHASAELQSRLGTPERIEKITTMIFQKDREAVASQIHPFLAIVPGAAAAHLAERLASEKDRSRRGRLLDALKSIGSAAAGPLKEALHASEWFVVRNALNVLGEIGDPALMDDVAGTVQHGDPRVRRAAVRALWKLGAEAAEDALVERLSDPDFDTRMEALFCLTEMKSRGAVTAIAELTKPGKWLTAGKESERLRERAAEALGQIAVPGGIPALAELLKRKGLLGGYEPLELRLVAAKALRAIGAPEALEVLQRAVEEAKAEAKAALQRVLEGKP